MNTATTKSELIHSARDIAVPSAFVRLFNKEATSSIKKGIKEFQKPIIEEINAIKNMKAFETGYGFKVCETVSSTGINYYKTPALEEPDSCFKYIFKGGTTYFLRFAVKGRIATSYANDMGVFVPPSPITDNYMAVREILMEKRYKILENRFTAEQIHKLRS